MIHKIQKYIATNNLLAFDKPVITGFSGGSDSVSLLHILNRLGYKCIAAHCNFHLRENESDQDETFCEQFTKEHNIPLDKVDFDTKSYAKAQHISIEMAARNLRYEWFETIRKKYDAQAIAVAHHCDDSNETMLLNMIRGTGIRGLCGIRPKNRLVIRPLLCIGKDDIMHYLEEQGLPYVTDSSNLSDEYTRNFIRLHLIPLMEEINPSVKIVLARTAEHLSDAENIYNNAVEEIRKSLIKESNNDEFQISIDDLIKQPASKTILFELLKPFGFKSDVSESIHNSLMGEPGKTFNSLDHCYTLLKDRKFLYIYKRQKKIYERHEIEEDNKNCDKLPIDISFRKVKVDSSFDIDKAMQIATLDYDKVKFPLTLRKWQLGDWFIPFGMKGRKKLSDYFSDCKFSILDKEKIWVLCSGEDIIWIVGKRTDNRFCISDDTKYALIINFSEKNCNN